MFSLSPSILYHTFFFFFHFYHGFKHHCSILPTAGGHLPHTQRRRYRYEKVWRTYSALICLCFLSLPYPSLPVSVSLCVAPMCSFWLDPVLLWFTPSLLDLFLHFPSIFFRGDETIRGAASLYAHFSKAEKSLGPLIYYILSFSLSNTYKQTKTHLHSPSLIVSTFHRSVYTYIIQVQLHFFLYALIEPLPLAQRYLMTLLIGSLLTLSTFLFISSLSFIVAITLYLSSCILGNISLLLQFCLVSS